MKLRNILSVLAVVFALFASAGAQTSTVNCGSNGTVAGDGVGHLMIDLGPCVVTWTGGQTPPASDLVVTVPQYTYTTTNAVTISGVSMHVYSGSIVNAAYLVDIIAPLNQTFADGSTWKRFYAPMGRINATVPGALTVHVPWAVTLPAGTRVQVNWNITLPSPATNCATTCGWAGKTIIQ